MAVSKCPKCDHTSFEIKDVVPQGATYKYRFIQCASCGAVVGTLEHLPLGPNIEAIWTLVQRIALKIGG